jgi:hypothetical protein
MSSRRTESAPFIFDSWWAHRKLLVYITYAGLVFILLRYLSAKFDTKNFAEVNLSIHLDMI